MAGIISEKKINEDISKDITSNLNSDLNENNVIIEFQEPSEIESQTRGINDDTSEKKKHVNIFKQFLLKRVYITAITFYIIYFIFNTVYNIILHLFIKKDLSLDDTESVSSSTSSNQQELESLFEKNKTILLILYLTVIGPIIEEIIFRLCIFKPIQLLGKKVSKSSKFLGWIIILLAFIISSAIFAYGHFSFSFSTLFDEIEYFPTYFIMGILLACAYNYDGYLAASILTHILNNTISTLIMYFSTSGLMYYHLLL